VTFRRCVDGIVVVLACAGLHAACAEHIGKKAAQGAMTELRRQHEEYPEQRPARIAAASAVEGAMEALDTPEQRARIERLLEHAIALAAQTAADTAAREMVASLGPDGQGPLANSLSKVGENMATSAVGGVGAQLASLVPECTGPDQLECIERRLQRTAHATAASFTSGVKESIGWQLLLIAFVVGAGGGLLASWLWSLRHVRRRGLREARAV